MLTPNFYGTELDERGLKMIEKAMMKPITMDEIQMMQELNAQVDAQREQQAQERQQVQMMKQQAQYRDQMANMLSRFGRG